MLPSLQTTGLSDASSRTQLCLAAAVSGNHSWGPSPTLTPQPRTSAHLSGRALGKGPLLSTCTPFYLITKSKISKGTRRSLLRPIVFSPQLLQDIHRKQGRSVTAEPGPLGTQRQMNGQRVQAFSCCIFLETGERAPCAFLRKQHYDSSASILPPAGRSCHKPRGGRRGDCEQTTQRESPAPELSHSAPWISFFNYCCDKHKPAVAAGLAEQPVLRQIPKSKWERGVAYLAGWREGKGPFSLSPNTPRVVV